MQINGRTLRDFTRRLISVSSSKNSRRVDFPPAFATDCIQIHHRSIQWVAVNVAAEEYAIDNVSLDVLMTDS